MFLNASQGMSEAIYSCDEGYAPQLQRTCYTENDSTIVSGDAGD